MLGENYRELPRLSVTSLCPSSFNILLLLSTIQKRKAMLSFASVTASANSASELVVISFSFFFLSFLLFLWIDLCFCTVLICASLNSQCLGQHCSSVEIKKISRKGSKIQGSKRSNNKQGYRDSGNKLREKIFCFLMQLWVYQRFFCLRFFPSGWTVHSLPSLPSPPQPPPPPPTRMSKEAELSLLMTYISA